MKPARLNVRTQRGATLMVLLAIIVIASAYLLVSRMHAASGFVAIDRNHNAQVMNHAKQALIGYVAQKAAGPTEDDPGRLPCPEAPASFGTANEGIAAGSCTLPAVGRLPWRTLGLDKLVDAASEPLWYVVSPGWALPNSTTHTLINSNSIGQLTVDGAANDSVALIIAAGPAMVAPAAAGCTAWTQSRATVGAPDRRNYLECDNAAGAAFVSGGPSGALNDQVLRVTVQDVMPAIEAAIEARIEREIAPLLKGVYASNTWAAGLSAAAPAYPYPAPFADPALTASYRGASGSCAGNVCTGLLPVNFSNNPGTVDACTPSAGSPCDPTFVSWSAGTVTQTGGGLTMVTNPSTCTVATGVAWGTSTTSRLDCVLTARAFLLSTNTINFQVTATASNVAMAMRQFNAGSVTLANATLVGTPTVTLNSDGSATVRANGTVTLGGGLFGNLVGDLLCSLSALDLLTFDCRQVTVQVPLATTASGPVFSDHALLNSNNATTGWFMRNEWYRVMYYAAAQGNTAAGLPAAPACTTGTNCLTVNNLSPANNKRSLVFLAGRSRVGTIGATRTLVDFLDTAENRDGNATFEKLPVGSLSNDRVVIVDAN